MTLANLRIQFRFPRHLFVLGGAIATVFLALGAPAACRAEEPAKRKLIVHVDDAGMCHSANVATIKGLESGVVTSTSIMMPCSWVGEFAEYARKHPQYCYGVHFTLNCEWDAYRWGPVAGRKEVPSLVDQHGFLWGSVGDVAKHAKAEEVEIELRAQIELAKQLGIPLSHLDTHMGAVMARPDIVQVYVKLGIEYDLPFLWKRQANALEKTAYPHLAAALDEVVTQLDQRKLPVLDHLLQFYGGDDLAKREQTYKDAIEKLSPGISQLIIHSSVDGEELQAITTSHLRRHQDFELFSSPAMMKFIQDQGIELTSWKQLTQAARR
ncbi:MAG: polysaccharide deacetylase family protein [Pirellulaceae bacterium]|nr:polysaccharide deacetylase family protein [Pirellulaceae bacterium]